VWPGVSNLPDFKVSCPQLCSLSLHPFAVSSRAGHLPPMAQPPHHRVLPISRC
jgi:hypothetical protein